LKYIKKQILKTKAEFSFERGHLVRGRRVKPILKPSLRSATLALGSENQALHSSTAGVRYP
jgi:hypothetical protein